jgi:hypothetical protein
MHLRRFFFLLLFRVCPRFSFEKYGYPAYKLSAYDNVEINNLKLTHVW